MYSFGVVLVELVTGRKAIDINRPKGQQCLTEWVRIKQILKIYTSIILYSICNIDVLNMEHLQRVGKLSHPSLISSYNLTKEDLSEVL